MSPWVEVTLSLQEALHHLQCPREERKKGSVNTAIFVSTVKLVFFLLLIYRLRQVLMNLLFVVLQRTRPSQIIPCTVSQLWSASQSDETFKVGEVELAQVGVLTVFSCSRCFKGKHEGPGPRRWTPSVVDFRSRSSVVCRVEVWDLI